MKTRIDQRVRRLALHRESLRNLNGRELRRARGGDERVPTMCECWTFRPICNEETDGCPVGSDGC